MGLVFDIEQYMVEGGPPGLFETLRISLVELVRLPIAFCVFPLADEPGESDIFILHFHVAQ
jgi:hypothetical protein